MPTRTFSIGVVLNPIIEPFPFSSASIEFISFTLALAPKGNPRKADALAIDL